MKRLFFWLLILFLARINATVHASTLPQERTVATTIFPLDSLSVIEENDGYVVFIPMTGKGYVIVSKKNVKIIGYSRESLWSRKAFPQVLNGWLDLNSSSGGDRSVSESSITEVKRSIGKQKIFSVSPLLSTRWHQQYPYNKYAPVISDGNIKTVAGCVAIAAAQITYYWWRDNPTATLRDTPIYPYGGAPVTYSIPKGTPNDWNMIKNEYNADDTESSKDAVGRLCYVVGTTSYLNYATSTGGQIIDASNALLSQYNLVSDYLSRNNCNQEEWELLLLEELSNGRPVLCSGTGSGGHAFVLDGYDSETGLYHFNFGWGGSGDGYYPIDDSENSMGGYSKNQSVVYNIHPIKKNIKSEILVTGRVEDGYNIHLSVVNKGTLPSLLKLIVGKTNSNNSLSDNVIWEGVVNNDSLNFDVDIIIKAETMGSNNHVYLIDEYGTPIHSHAVNIDGIDAHYLEESDSDILYYGIDGVKRKNKKRNALYIMSKGNRNKKIIIR